MYQIANRQVSVSECQPKFDGQAPQEINKTMRHDYVMYVAGSGPKDSGVMFVSQALEDDEAREVQGLAYGFTVRQPPAYLKGDLGVMLKDCAEGVGLNLKDHYYTSLIKWLLPKGERNNPPKEAVKWAMVALDLEIKECKPRIIVCLGKAPFDALVSLRINATDALGGWFWSDTYQCKVFLMEKPGILLFKPERLEQFRLLFREVRRMITDGDFILNTKDYKVIHNSGELRALVAMFREENRTLFAVDCEWGGTTFMDGRLRTFQMCWEPGKAAAVRFRDDQDKYVFDVTYEEAGVILGEWLNEPQVKYVGHYISVDLPWMHRWLKLDWYKKSVMDTAFALQVVDEHAPTGLEWLSMYATDMGRYDLPLLLWKKANPQKEEDGYAFIPDDILLPYSLQDVDATMQGHLWLLRKLEIENCTEYYNNIFHPFVTDVFTSFVIHGLPIDKKKLTGLRKIYNFAYDILQDDFRLDMVAEARFMLIRFASELLGTAGLQTALQLIKTVESQGKWQEQLDGMEELTPEHRKALTPFLEHMECCPRFNIRSKPQMVRWLFAIKRHMPIKSTDNKPKGLRAMPWEKVLALPPEKRKDYAPASDKQTLQILSEKDPMVDRLFDLNVVGNICNSFLKKASVDPETDELISENGLFSHLCSDDRIRAYWGCTETSRGRTFLPNILNWPSYVTERLSKTIGRLMLKLDLQGKLPEEFRCYLPDEDSDEAKIHSIRSCVVAPPGWCIPESDYKTAEVLALAALSGDQMLLKLMTEHDPDFCLVRDGGDTFKVRTAFIDPWECGIPKENQFPDCLNAIWKKGKKVRDVDPREFLRDSAGNLRHPGYDLHWSLAEMLYELPRERMLEKLHRQVGKTGNFCIASNQLVLTKDRGSVAIQDILLDDLLWDGTDWVSHAGVVFCGEAVVYAYQGLWATENHEVWVYDDSFLELPLSGDADVPIERCAFSIAIESGFDLVNGRCPRVSQLDKYTRTDPEFVGLSLKELPRGVCRVYDILNAGPKHRFTCSGVLVSNSTAYGASENSLERKIEADTGKKPEPGTGRKLLDALERRQPRAVQFLRELENLPGQQNAVYVAASGRKRRFHKHPMFLGQENWRLVKSLLSSLGREARNFPMQESVAATAARAGAWLLEFKHANNLQGFQAAILYDSVVTICPENERWIWHDAHELFMHRANAWNYEGRILRYPIDTDFNTAWSVAASGDAKVNLSNPEYEKTPARLMPVLAWLRAQLKQAQ